MTFRWKAQFQMARLPWHRSSARRSCLIAHRVRLITRRRLRTRALTSALSASPRTILQTLADKVLEVLHAHSAGLSLLTKDERDLLGSYCYGAGASRRQRARFRPCGDVLDHNIPMLFLLIDIDIHTFHTPKPLAHEGLLVPFYVNGKAAGTIWAIAHNDSRKFDAEDLRLLESTSCFAAAAYHAVEPIDGL